MKIKEGMLVKIINVGDIYETYDEWLIKNLNNNNNKDLISDLISWNFNNNPEDIAELKLRRRNEWEDSYSDECYSDLNCEHKDDYYKRKVLYDEINSSPYIVKLIAPYALPPFEDRTLAFIRHSLSGRGYIIDVKGLEPYEDVIEPFNFLKKKDSYTLLYYIIKTDKKTLTCIDIKRLRIVKLYISDIKNSDYEVVSKEEYSCSYENMLSDLRKMKEALDIIEGEENNEI